MDLQEEEEGSKCLNKLQREVVHSSISAEKKELQATDVVNGKATVKASRPN